MDPSTNPAQPAPTPTPAATPPAAPQSTPEMPPATLPADAPAPNPVSAAPASTAGDGNTKKLLIVLLAVLVIGVIVYFVTK